MKLTDKEFMTNEDFEQILKDKVIKKAAVSGYRINLEFEDGSYFEYEASDGGYSTYEYLDKTEYEARQIMRKALAEEAPF